MTKKILHKEILTKNISKDGVDYKCDSKIVKAPVQSPDSTSGNLENNKIAKAQRMQDPVSPKLLNLKQAAIYLGCSVRWVRTLVYNHEFPCIQEGDRGKIWIKKDRLDEWINRKERLA